MTECSFMNKVVLGSNPIEVSGCYFFGGGILLFLLFSVWRQEDRFTLDVRLGCQKQAFKNIWLLKKFLLVRNSLWWIFVFKRIVKGSGLLTWHSFWFKATLAKGNNSFFIRTNTTIADTHQSSPNNIFPFQFRQSQFSKSWTISIAKNL